MIKLLVPVKRVVDYSVKVMVKKDGSGVETAGVKMSLNPFDEVSMELAAQLREKGVASEVISMTVGPLEAKKVLQQTLASGADRGIHVISETDLEPLHVSKIIKSVVEMVQPDLVILGKQAVGDENSQTGQMLAGLLGWAQATCLASLRVEGEGRYLDIEREVDRGLERIEVPLPAIVTSDLRLNTPRFTTIQNIIKAKKKSIQTIDIDQLGAQPHNSRLSMIGFSEPAAKNAGVIFESVEELTNAISKIIKI